MVKLLIIADDFTGAIDSGAQFAKAGIGTLVMSGESFQVEAAYSGTQVLVIDTETRHSSPQEAYGKVYGVARQAYQAGVKHIFKKVDSTLRGNIGCELAAVMAAIEKERLYLVPSYPEQNRVTINGMQFVDGLPLKDSAFANDPFNPVFSNSVAEIVARQTDIPVFLATPQNLAAQRAAVDGKAIIAVDSRTREDILAIGEELREEKGILMAGAAGVSEILPMLLGLKGQILRHPVMPKKALVVCGSLHPSALKQVARAEQLGVPTVVLGKEQKLTRYWGNVTGQHFIQDLLYRLELFDLLIIKMVSDPGGSDSFMQPERTDVPAELHLEIAQTVGELVAQLMSGAEIDLLIVFGGDTLFSILANLDCGSVEPQTEIMPGVVQSKIIWRERAVTVISKAGGFGEKDALVDLLSHYKIGFDL